MSQRENGPIPEKYILWRPEVIDGERWYVLLVFCISMLTRSATGI